MSLPGWVPVASAALSAVGSLFGGKGGGGGTAPSPAAQTEAEDKVQEILSRIRERRQRELQELLARAPLDGWTERGPMPPPSILKNLYGGM